jgi:hypothetical protein
MNSRIQKVCRDLQQPIISIKKEDTNTSIINHTKEVSRR